MTKFRRITSSDSQMGIRLTVKCIFMSSLLEVFFLLEYKPLKESFRNIQRFGKSFFS